MALSHLNTSSNASVLREVLGPLCYYWEGVADAQQLVYYLSKVAIAHAFPLFLQSAQCLLEAI